MKISPARVAAFEALLRILEDRAFSSIVLPAVEESLEGPDRGLCHEIVLGTLRNELLLGSYIRSLTKGKKLDSEVRVILLSAAYQILFLDRIPHHAVVNDAVNLAVRAKKSSARGLVNAVLRSFSRERPSLEFQDELDRLSVETSHPRWLLERWILQFGSEGAAQLAIADNEQPKVSVRGTAKNPEPTAAQRSGDLRALADAGQIYLQDEGSQLIASAVRFEPGDRVLDVCAAPGSKATMMAVGHIDDGTMIVAGDLHDARVRQLKASAALQGAESVSVVRYDAVRALPFADGSFDAVLVDAPCSGTGTIRHNPEIRYFLEPTDFADLADKQLAILENASKLVRSGGTLVYSTCSLENEENEAVCRRFLERHAGIRLKRPAVPEKFLTEEGFARTFPHRDGMDGFFVAAFEKV